MVIDVDHISIRYMIGDFKSIGFKEYIIRKISGKYAVQELWAVNNVSFSLDRGDILGIIGENGAGKSTVLKAISGIMKPSDGKIICSGMISSLLELGTGFDDDLTVSENIYLRGAMMGYSRGFLKECYNDILCFAELQDFESQVFKHLSSGMKSRLAFSIASLVQPDILVLDEVLAVGDGAFRKKSEAKMREIMSAGTATILVSHSLEQIREICNRVLWLDHGVQKAYGNTNEICDRYEAFLASKTQ